MSNTEQKAKVKRQKVKVKATLHVLGGRMPSLRLLFAFCLFTFAFVFSGCRMDMQDQPKYKTFRAGDQKFGINGASVRPLVEGTVPRRGAGADYRDSEDYFYTGKTAGQVAAGASSGGAAAMGGMQQMGADASAAVAGGAHVHGASEMAAAAGGPDVFPIEIDRAALERGRERFQIYCVVCHGFTGEADGMIVRRGFRKPPSYYEDRLQEGTTPASHFFDVITNGWGAMPDYSAQIPPEDRWKIIAYIRTLQLSRKVKMEELSPEARQKVLSGAQKPSGEHEGGSQQQLQSPQTGGTSSQVEGNH